MKPKNYRPCYLALASGLAVILLVAFMAGLGGFPSARAYTPSTTYIVTNTDSSGDGSLRRAILDANLNPGADNITFNIPGCAPATPCVIQPLNPLPMITDSVTITGPGTTSLILDANYNMRGFNINVSEPVTITDLTIQNGATAGVGAGIRSFSALTLIRVQLLQNQAEDDGGGVYAEGDLHIIDSYFANNSSLGSGGGLYAEGWLELENSEFFSNTAVQDGGGAWGYDVLVTGGEFTQNRGFEGGGLMASNTLALTGTTFLHNMADFWGGGLSGSDAQINQARFENNHGQDGGGLYSCCYLTMENSTFLENTATDGDGGGVLAQSAVLTTTTFLSNTAYGQGGGLYTFFGVQAV